jgi:hypothetical protein
MIARESPSSAPPASAPPPFREIVTDAARYWEPRRLGYNALLGAIFLGWVGFTWPHFRGAFTWSALGALTVLALLANVCYCTAYLIDIPLQYSPLRAAWRRRRRVLWLLGAIFAAALTWYWVADEIYPGVG